MQTSRKALLPILLVLLSVLAFHQQQNIQSVRAQQTAFDCSYTFTFTGNANQTGQDNRPTSRPCVAFRVTFTTTGTLTATVAFQTSPDNITFTSVPNSICSASVQPPCLTDGANPTSAARTGTLAARAYNAWTRLSVSGSSGSGTGTAVVYGYKGTSASVSTGGSGGGGGSGTVTNTSGNLTANAIVTGNGGADIKTPSATSTLDASGNESIPGTLSTGVGGGASGSVTMTGSASGSVKIQAAAAQGTPNPLQLPTTTGTAGQLLATDGGNPQQASWVSGAAPTGAAGGDLKGSFPNPLVGQIHDNITTITAASSPYTVVGTDFLIICNAVAGPITINLPLATGSGREIDVKQTNANAGGNTCTITRAGADNIDGAASVVMSAQFASVKIVDSSSGTWVRTHVNQLSGDVTGASTANTANVARVINCPDTSVTPNVITCVTASGFPAAYVEGQFVLVEMNTTNTGATTINIAARGAIAVTTQSISALSAGALISGGVYLLSYDGAQFQVVGSTPGPSNVRVCEIVIGDPGAASPALANDNDSPSVCGNTTGATLTITAVECFANAGSPTVTPIITGGGATSILTGALTCGTGAFATGTLNGTPTETNGQSIDGNITVAGGVAKYIVIRITRTL